MSSTVVADEFLTPAERADVLARVERDYARIFPPGQVQGHLENHAGRLQAAPLVDHVLSTSPARTATLDVGCGLGSFVLEARLRGLDAIGIDQDEHDLAFARRRLGRMRPGDAAARVFRKASATALPFPDASFGAVTFWNVLEHLDAPALAIQEAYRVLAPGGVAHVVCPNYLALREEAHYHVPWFPLLPKRLGSTYLRALGRDPDFFQRHIHYRTNGGTMRMFRRAGFKVEDPRAAKLARRDTIASPRKRRMLDAVDRWHAMPVLHAGLRLTFHNPFRHTVAFTARKPIPEAHA